MSRGRVPSVKCCHLSTGLPGCCCPPACLPELQQSPPRVPATATSAHEKRPGAPDTDSADFTYYSVFSGRVILVSASPNPGNRRTRESRDPCWREVVAVIPQVERTKHTYEYMNSPYMQRRMSDLIQMSGHGGGGAGRGLLIAKAAGPFLLWTCSRYPRRPTAYPDCILGGDLC